MVPDIGGMKSGKIDTRNIGSNGGGVGGIILPLSSGGLGTNFNNSLHEDSLSYPYME